MFRSTGWRFLAVGVLVLVMSIPLGLVSDVVQERARYSEQTVADISREWGGAQLISGPLLVSPVTEDVARERRRHAKDPNTRAVLRDAIERNQKAADGLDEAIREVLAK